MTPDWERLGTYCSGVLLVAVVFGLLALPEARIVTTATQLRLSLRPLLNWALGWVGLWLGGFFLLWVLTTGIPVREIACQHDLATETRACQVREWGWFEQLRAESELADFQEAIIEPDGEPPEHVRLVLRGLAGEYAFPWLLEPRDRDNDPDYRQIRELASRLNQFQITREPQIELSYDERGILYTGIGLGLFCLAIASGFIFSAPRIVLILDKEAQTYELQRQRWGGLLRKTWQGSLLDLARVELESCSSPESSGSRVVLVLKSGDRLPLTYLYTSEARGRQSLASQLRTFLKRTTPQTTNS